MNKLLLVLMLITSSAFCQFQLSSSVGYGITVNSKADYTLFQSVINVSPQFEIYPVTIAGQSLAVNTDSNTTMYNGLSVSGIVKKFDENKFLSIGGHYLLGFEGDYLAGGSIGYNYDAIGFNISFSQEYLRRELWVIGSISYNIIN